MIDCKNESTLSLLKKDYDDFVLLLLLSFFLIWYFQHSFTKAIFKSFVILSIFLIFDMSCYHVDYIKGLCVSMIIGINLENAYNLFYYYFITYLYKKKKKIDEILEKEHLEIDDDIKDKPNKAE